MPAATCIYFINPHMKSGNMTASVKKKKNNPNTKVNLPVVTSLTDRGCQVNNIHRPLFDRRINGVTVFHCHCPKNYYLHSGTLLWQNNSTAIYTEDSI